MVDQPQQPPHGGNPPHVTHAPWWRRAVALAIDLLPVFVLLALSLAVMWFTRIRACDTDVSALDLAAECGTAISTIGETTFRAVWLISVGYGVWNLGWRQGRSGASLGKSVTGIRVVNAGTGRPVGVAWSLVRTAGQLLNVVTLGVGYLWALVDRRRQTFADKLVGSVCVRDPAPSDHAAQSAGHDRDGHGYAELP